MEPLRLSRRDARRIAVRAQLLTALASGDLVELRGMIRPGEDIALFRAEMACWRGEGDLESWQLAQREWVEANDGARRDLLELIEVEGPKTSRELPDTTAVPWQLSGWNNDRNVRMLVGLMERRGELAVGGYRGRDRLWDLAERVFPDSEVVPLLEAQQERDHRRLAALGIARAKGPECPVEPDDVGQAGVEAVVDGVRGTWRVDPSYLDDLPVRPRTVLLSPLDRLLMDRKRMAELLDFDYQLEMYRPRAKRRWGYWAMPILHGTSLVGKLDATADRERGVLRVDAIHEDGAWSATRRDAVRREVRALGRFLDLRVEGAVD